MAASFGIKIENVRYINFFVGSALAALAGVMVALLNNLVEPTMGAVPAYKALAIIVYWAAWVLYEAHWSHL